MSSIELIEVHSPRLSTVGMEEAAAGSPLDNALFADCKAGNLKILLEQLADLKPSVAGSILDSDGWGPFHYIAMKGHIELAKAMLAHGVPVDVLDRFGATPMYRAVGFGQVAMVHFLAENGANPLAVNESGHNMLHNSARNGNSELTEFFISKGVSPIHRDNASHTPLMDMVKNTPEECVKWLDTRTKVLDKYMLMVHSEHDFDGIDDLDGATGDMTPLELIVKKRNHELISHRLIRKLCDWKWRVFARRFFLRQLLGYLYALGLLTYICLAVVAFPGTVLFIYDSSQAYFRAVIEILFLIFVFSQLFDEIMEFINSGKDIVHVPAGAGGWLLRVFFPKAIDPAFVHARSVYVPRYLRDLGNVFDLTTYFMVVIDMGMRIANIVAYESGNIPPVSVQYEYNVLAMVAVLYWTKFLRIAALFKVTGPLIETIKYMMVDLVIFMAIFTVFLMGFSIGFFVLLSPNSSAPIAAAGTPDYESFQQSLLTGLLGLFGELNLNPFRVADKSVAYLGYVVFIIISNIALLNCMLASPRWTYHQFPPHSQTSFWIAVLIAMLSNTYATIKYVSDNEFLLVRARYILAVQKNLGRKNVQEQLAADLKRREAQHTQVITENNTPEAEFTHTNKYSDWTKVKETQEQREVNLQLLRDDIFKMSGKQFQEMHEVFGKMAASIERLEKRMARMETHA
ncbi:hypothetical protein CAOG_003147 [Capsaspora owczarzaki ATCC 30864]|uniref:Ion transport domain-containing protein n=1 Tax=Capsaspora owczarzaki (strain ATCC 30864) TaxID=595528 RepID=A0A0D2VP26_CAPO3|nr:hypothetical protein CAOG_003147 [Capsaspora owczarzaki ATCC 30864]